MVSVSLLPVHPILTAARGVLLMIPILQANELRCRRLKLLPTVTWLLNGGAGLELRSHRPQSPCYLNDKV